MEFWVTLLSSGAVSAALSAGIVFLAKTWMGTRIEQSIRHEYDIRLTTYRNELERDKALALERLRSDLAEMQATQATALAAMAEGQRQSHEKRLEAVALFWSEIVKLKSSIPEILHFTNVIVPEEYQLLVEREDFRERVTAATNSDLLFNVDEPAIQNARLFGGHELYACFFSYRQIIGRILYLFSEGLETGKLAPWMEEKGMLSILGATFNELELARIEEQKIGTLNFVLDLLEHKFLSYASTMVSGQHAAIETAGSGKKIVDVARELGRADEKI